MAELTFNVFDHGKDASVPCFGASCRWQERAM